MQEQGFDPSRLTVAHNQVRTVAGPGGPRQLQWSPQLDLRSCGMEVILNCLETLRGGVGDDGAAAPWLAAMLESHGITLVDLATAGRVFTTALMDAMENPFKPPQACLDDAGWSQIKPTAATLIFAQFGLRFTGAVITGNHATTDAADTWPTYMDALKAIGRAAEGFAAAANGGPKAPPEA